MQIRMPDAPGPLCVRYTLRCTVKTRLQSKEKDDKAVETLLSEPSLLKNQRHAFLPTECALTDPNTSWGQQYKLLAALASTFYSSFSCRAAAIAIPTLKASLSLSWCQSALSLCLSKSIMQRSTPRSQGRKRGVESGMQVEVWVRMLGHVLVQVLSVHSTFDSTA
ncbi:hypothetical protein BCV70DRAFT_113135 [Testicularia cyperi]|uniref:Uncharacterized protein n=1 Tax=Testicularia cyperi TaxID=1882483 RepID=A0A317XNA3_9BASI|nr:hypothetical protein BCV70DRAFT_113135 [Testicularia cyperi]